jgi:uncharacterized protein (TIGR03083 family)
MDITMHLSALARDGELLADAAHRAGLDAITPSCPGWTVRDLVRHVGQVHRWAADHVAEERLTQNKTLADWPADTDLFAWYYEGHADLLKTLTAADPELDCWHFLPAASGLRFWARRQAHETAIHRVDAQLAAGQAVTPFDAVFAADGVDEVLYGFFARRPSRFASSQPYSIGLIAADLPRSWQIAVDAEGAHTGRLIGDADCEVRATASDLYLLLWNRGDLSGLDVSGDTAGLEHWRDHAHVRWS